MSDENKSSKNTKIFYFSRIFYIIYILLSIYALYISLDCNNEIISFESLIALLFPFIYIPIRLYSKQLCKNPNIGPICIA